MDNVMQLKKVFAAYPECVRNQKLFNALLLDFFYEDKMVRNIYKVISEEGILSDIVCSQEVSNIDIERYCLIIHNSYGIEKEKVKPCIYDILYALDKLIDKKLKTMNVEAQDDVANKSGMALYMSNLNDVQIGIYLGVSSETNRGLIESKDTYYNILPSIANIKAKFLEGETIYFLTESKRNLKFATVVSRTNDVSDYKKYPLLNRKWEGVINTIDHYSQIGSLHCRQLSESIDIFINGKVRKQNLKAGEKVIFEIDVLRNQLLATEIERVNSNNFGF